MTPTFADLGVPAPLCRALDELGIQAPFPIQAATLPDALAGRDLCGKAPTGSGKTIAFGLPLLARVGRAAPRRPRGLVLVPTRELAAQVCDQLALLAGAKGPTVASFYGGAGFERQLKALRRGVDIAVACPGRLADLVGRGDIRLDQVEVVVIDEADRMADMGFLPEVKRLLDQVPDRRQTLLFSATLDGAVDELIRRYQSHPARHELAADPSDGARVQHLFWKVGRDQRIALCAQTVDRLGSTIVFCRTKRGADRVARQLETYGVSAAAIHGNRSQGQRERALAAFQAGRVQALVATDVAARGIHVDQVDGVLHLDPPADEKDYIHRSGLTGRAGAPGTVVSFVAPELRKEVAAIQRRLELAPGLTEPDVADLVAGARPASRPVPSERAERHDDPRGSRPRPSHKPHRTKGPGHPKGQSKGESKAQSKGQSKAQSNGQSKGQPKGPSTRRSGSASPAPGGNRKARRAHLQPGTSASPGTTSAQARRSRRGADVGKRRQPSGSR